MSKKKELIERARATVRVPQPPSSIDLRPQKRGYRVVAVSLYSPEADWLDQIARSLQQAGNPKANRSLVVREALLRLQEALNDKTPKEILTDFTDRHAKRVHQEPE